MDTAVVVVPIIVLAVSVDISTDSIMASRRVARHIRPAADYRGSYGRA